jgi:hypothetical protein
MCIYISCMVHYFVLVVLYLQIKFLGHADGVLISSD